MASQERQTNTLFASSWRKVYQAFSQVNFVASDFDTYQQVMKDYISINFPEDFNDWVENSEIVILMRLLAYLGENLNYKIDLNARDNFIALAERRQSVLNLARMVGYYPKRNIPATGIAKITEVKTDEDIKDSSGLSLRNVPIRWNDESNVNWLEQFILVLNSSFVYNNPFGRPLKVGEVGGVQTQIYQVNSAPASATTFPFNITVNGQSVNLEAVNPDFEDQGIIFERQPSPTNSMNVIYRNDGTGNESINTGFFILFKQGTLRFKDFNFTTSVENRIVNIDASNINEEDVWVQEVNENSGTIRNSWVKVPSLFNITYNNLNKLERNIYQIQTRDDDQIAIKFPDGRFGNIPKGIFRVWHRISNGLRYTIRPQDLRNVDVSIPYKRNTSIDSNETFKLNVKISLQYRVQGSQPKETTEQVRTRAPQAFYTQNRMISAQDYNVFPLTLGNIVRKIKSINRTYAGHSRYIDLNDPTGSYQNTNVFGDDGMIYSQETQGLNQELLPTTKTPQEIVDSKILPLLDSADIVNFYYANYPTYDWLVSATKVKWLPSTNQSFTMTGKFVDSTNADAPLAIAVNGAVDNGQFITEGSLIRFVNDPILGPGDPGYQEKWVKVNTISSGYPTDLISGAGPVTIAEALDPNFTWYVDILYANFSLVLGQTEINDIITEIELNNTFGIRYDQTDNLWKIISESNLNLVDPFSLTFAGDNSNTNKDSSWLILVQYSSSAWSFNARYLEYIFESLNEVRFFFDNQYKVNDIITGKQVQDFVKVLKINSKLSDPSVGIGEDFKFSLTEPIVYDDGFTEPRRVKITMADTDDDGVPDNPIQFEEIIEPVLVPTAADNRFLFWQKVLSSGGYSYYVAKDNIIVADTMAGVTGPAAVFYVIDSDGFGNPAFKIWDGFVATDPTDPTLYIVREGRDDLYFQWRHFANIRSRIDPAPSNIMDIYVLTETYYQDVTNWQLSTNRGDFPEPPNSEDLRVTFQSLNENKSVSDSIIWHSAKYKLLFGEEAIPELRADFRVVKIDGTTVSDNEIKQRIVTSINTFFNVDNWSFGDKFSFTELATYIHQQLPSIISSVVIVPSFNSSKFGTLFEIRFEEDELPLTTATVANVQIINSLTSANIRIGN